MTLFTRWTAGSGLPFAPRRGGALAAAAGAALALAGAAAPATAVAADACPNAEVRARQGGAHLPDCRAYEQVSPVEKHGNEAFPGRVSVAGPGIVQFRGAGAFGDALSTVGAAYVADRTESGWATQAVLPPMLGPRPPASSDTPEPTAVTPDLGSMIVQSQFPYFAEDVGSSSTVTPFLTQDVFRVDRDGTLTWLSAGATLPDASRENVQFMAADETLDRVLLRTRRVLDPAVPDEAYTQLYLSVDGGQAHLVSALPDGSPSTGVGQSNDLPPLTSADLSSLIFTSGARLYLRRDIEDPASRTVELLLGPDAVACNTPDPVAMDADARTLLVRCFAPVLPGDPADTPGLYRVDLDDPSDTELVALPGLTYTQIAATDDLSRVWFSSDSDRLPGDAGSIFLLRDGVVERVARGTGTAASLVSDVAEVSADGENLVFASRATFPGLANGGFRQVYRHSLADGRLTCVSCPADGSPATGIADIRPYGESGGEPAMAMGAVSADGRRIFLTSDTALVARDTNGVSDPYVVQDGVPQILSSGRWRIGSVFAGASADGSEAFLVTSESLVPQDVDNGVSDVYVARVNGGFAAEDDVAECTVGCRGPLPTPEQPPVPGTFTFTGPGDVDDAEVPEVAKVFAPQPVGARARRSLARGGRAALQVAVSHAGTVRAVVRARIGRRSVIVGTAERRASAGGTVRLTLKLSRAARRQLRRTGALRVTVRVTYSERGGAQQTSFVLRSNARRGARR